MAETTSHPTNLALIVAAGRGQRAGDGLPKQYRALPDRPNTALVTASLAAFLHHDAIDFVAVVIHQNDIGLYQASVRDFVDNPKLLPPIIGGATRQQSVLLGLEGLAAQFADTPPKQVLVHDAARPYISNALISRCLLALGSAAGAVPALPVTDTLKRGDNGKIAETVSRDGLWQAQTPQAFTFAALLDAHRRAPQGLTDDAAVAEFAGLPIALVAGEAQNVKLTHEEDFMPPALQVQPRTGFGYDVHRFADAPSNSHIRLGGIDIAHTHQLVGHSDADVALHAVTDALLGALAQGDIGSHFPPSDDAHKDRDSADFLTHALLLADEAGARLTHIDVTLICQAPKIEPHREAMRQRLSELLRLPVAAISVKATTTEGLGFTGRGEGLAAQAVATVLMPVAE
jgi:2-C-methyl-D-erythritol 4-phosphate cytidylyltransferase/2-C-methyl-D-erythritol 2,4-cyclodiphosphate synthase